MVGRSIFVDSSGFYALLDRGDRAHRRAVALKEEWRKVGRRAFTSDYIVDETATLLKARGSAFLIGAFFSLLRRTEVLKLTFVSEERFDKTRDFFLKHADHDYSFTDCSSFVLMQELGASEALTTDRHFREAGFQPLLIE